MGIGYRQHLRQVALLSHRCAAFSLRVVKAFLKNRGILLAGGVGYNVLLSTIPLLALLCVFLTHIVDEQRLLGVVALQAQHLAPAQADLLIEAITDLMDARDLISVVGIAVLLFFSSLAFRMLEDAIAIIFHRPSMPTYRSFWVSALMPYIFILLLGAGLMMLTLLVGMATSLNDLVIAMWGFP
ncbi:MAG: YhjD/YihY/BrkB family envelope integrity protein, partial [Alphaproteobacteria bacterium]|nr:YhjD/YihY/BrkB family envelope integrity protein [Alphaproteobacteria bacterium]